MSVVGVTRQYAIRGDQTAKSLVLLNKHRLARSNPLFMLVEFSTSPRSPPTIVHFQKPAIMLVGQLKFLLEYRNVDNRLNATLTPP